MSAETTSILVGAICAVTGLGFWIWLVALPVSRSFEGGFQRSVAVVLSAYTLLVGVGIGAGIGLLVAYEWDRIAG
ncbi:MAG: hypothetical protein J7513_01525 [Solirubrobacteraceae bacterium]|nr:hypothetical protein [Solirubrobacteraceae bacterium]